MNPQKRVFIVHGLGGSPQNCWFPWLKNELEGRGFFVAALAMPHPEIPMIEEWVPYIANAVGESDENTFFVGHSIGCSAILRYIEGIESPVGGVVCVAGYLRMLSYESPEEERIEKPWLETEINFETIKRNIGKIVAIFSDDDPEVDLGNKALFEKNLSARTILEHNKGHFSDDAGVVELPSVLEAVVEIANEN